MKDHEKLKSRRCPIRVGILGGGQLARMLALAAHPLGIQPWVLSLSSDDPAAQVTSYWRRGDPNNKRDLSSFLDQVDYATFESEFLNATLLSEVNSKVGVVIHPSPSIMGALQDRLTQKQILINNHIPTLSFRTISTFSEAKDVLDEFGGSYILKKRRFGYDGYGTYPIHSHKDLNKILDEIKKNRDGFIAEKKIIFKRELAIIMVRNESGTIRQLPLVQTFQHHSRCLWVKGPINISEKMKLILIRIKKLLNQLNYCGVIAFELFESHNEIFVNEIAPRVHNSGHYSIEALSCNQFQYHIKALINHPLPKCTSLSRGFSMYNLLGESCFAPKLTGLTEGFMHWYGKKENRQGRKMGHITILDKTTHRAFLKAMRQRGKINL